MFIRRENERTTYSRLPTIIVINNEHCRCMVDKCYTRVYLLIIKQMKNQ